jgi:putative Holliday junction resolvase
LTLERRSRNEDFEQLAQIVHEEGVDAVLCGLPLNMDDSEGPQAQMTRKWALRLAHALRALLGRPIPVIFWDERLSSFAADELQAEKHDISERVGQDAIAAAVILRSYLDAQLRNDPQEFGRIDLPEK